MGYIFYDTETSGLSDEFDQIFQFSAIHTDDKLNIIDSIDLRARRLPHVIPSPGALLVTRVWPEQLEDAPLSHLEMVQKVREWIEARSPTQIMGFNSVKFDEEFLRQAFYKSLMAPYLTNTNGNQRGDIMRIAMATFIHAPGALEVPVKHTSKGEQRVFKLGDLALQNKLGIDLSMAHDALTDVRITIALAKHIKERAPEVWDRMRLNQAKADVMEFLEQTPTFTYSDFYFGKEYSWVVAPLGVNPKRETEFAVFDVLNFNPADFMGKTEEQISKILSRNPKPIRIVHTNWHPILMKPAMHPRWNGQGLRDDQKAFTDEEKKLIEERSRFLQANPQFVWKVQKAMEILTGKSEAERAAEAGAPGAATDGGAPVDGAPRVAGASTKSFEQLIYGGFPSKDDEALMQKFHQVSWKERADILGKFADSRFNQIAALIVYAESPESLSVEKRHAIAKWVHARLTNADEKAPYTTIPKARKELEGLRSYWKHSKEKLGHLDAIEIYLDHLETPPTIMPRMAPEPEPLPVVPEPPAPEPVVAKEPVVVLAEPKSALAAAPEAPEPKPDVPDAPASGPVVINVPPGGPITLVIGPGTILPPHIESLIREKIPGVIIVQEALPAETPVPGGKLDDLVREFQKHAVKPDVILPAPAPAAPKKRAFPRDVQRDEDNRRESKVRSFIDRQRRRGFSAGRYAPAPRGG